MDGCRKWIMQNPMDQSNSRTPATRIYRSSALQLTTPPNIYMWSQVVPATALMRGNLVSTTTTTTTASIRPSYLLTSIDPSLEEHSSHRRMHMNRNYYFQHGQRCRRRHACPKLLHAILACVMNKYWKCNSIVNLQKTCHKTLFNEWMNEWGG